MTFSKSTLKRLPIFILLAFMIQGCTSQESSNAEWQVEFNPGDANSYASVHVLSTKTGEYHQLYAEDGKWTKNPNIPSPASSVTKGNVRMEYLPGSPTVLPGINIYSATTGQWEQFYLQENKWNKNTTFPQPNISLPKGHLKMDFLPAVGNSLAGMAVLCEKTKQMEMLYLQDGKWHTNTIFPTDKQLK